LYRVLIKPAPRDYIESFIGGSDYWANGIRKEHRTTNPDQIAFCDTFKALLVELMAYVKEYHTTGVAWNAKGVNVSEYTPGASGSSVKAASAPFEAAPTPAVEKKAAAPSTAETAAPKVDLFAALNKGGAITSGLKTVTKDMQTWRAEYKGGDAPAPVKTAPKPAARSAAVELKGPAKVQYQDAGYKWLVEYQSEANGVVPIEIANIKQTVYIYGCVGATIDIKGKCKSIVVDGCKKTKVFFDSAMASCEIVNSQRMEIRVREKIAAVAIDKTDGIIVYLPESSLDTEIVASKSSEMNVTWPDASGDLIERPIPEQYVHRIKDGQITADVSDLYTH
jgi:adenylyl cyclase-associated protein